MTAGVTCLVYLELAITRPHCTRMYGSEINKSVEVCEGYFLYFGIRERKKILIIKNGLVLFKIFPIKIYTRSHAFEPIGEALLPL